MSREFKIDVGSRNVASACDFDTTRTALGNVLLANGGKTAVASDGRIMAAVPVASATWCDDSNPVTNDQQINGKAYAVAAKSKKDSAVLVNGRCETNGKVFERNTDGRFPAWENVIPQVASDAKVVSIDAKLLMALAEAVNEKGEYGVTLLIPNDFGPIAVMSSDRQGLGAIMPLGCKATREKHDSDEAIIASYTTLRAQLTGQTENGSVKLTKADTPKATNAQPAKKPASTAKKQPAIKSKVCPIAPAAKSPADVIKPVKITTSQPQATAKSDVSTAATETVAQFAGSIAERFTALLVRYARIQIERGLKAFAAKIRKLEGK